VACPLVPQRGKTATPSTNAWRMRELITFAVGQAGNQIATSFWETILSEHGLDHEGVRIFEAM